MNYKKLTSLIKDTADIVIIQADNPDADSLGSAIALEQILHGLKKNVWLYCGVNIPDYLHYLKGWSRVSNELPSKFDLAIIVDASTITLLEKLTELDKKKLHTAKVAIIDHHNTKPDIDFADLVIYEDSPATGEMIFTIAKDTGWKLNEEASFAIAASILGDTLGLMSKSTTSKTIRIMADLVDSGVSLSQLDSLRRESYKKSIDLTRYKGRLLQRLETYLDGKLVALTIPWEEIEKYSPLYNPPMLVLEDMKLVEGAAVAIVFKVYKDGKISAKIRSNNDYPVSNDLAKEFGGGGHDLASGFKTYDYATVKELLKKVISKTDSLLKGLPK